MAENALRRQLRPVRAMGPHQIRSSGRTLWNFASNDYLGMTWHPEVIRAGQEAMAQWGTGSGSSALLSGHSELHQQLSEFLVDWKSGSVPGWQCALFPTGYAANLGILTSLLAEDDSVFCDRKNHASIIDGLRMAQSRYPGLTVRYYRHRDFSHLESLLDSSSGEGRRWIVTDSVFSMDGTVVRPETLVPIADRYRAGLIVDEAHATGVSGSDGAGFFSRNAAQHVPLVVVGTLSKALGSMGGFVCGESVIIDGLVQSARSMIYSTALPPAATAVATTAGQIARYQPELRQQLQSHVAYLHRELLAQGWETTGDLQAPLLSVVTGNAESALELSEELQELGFYAPAIRPPTVKPNGCRIRLSPIATMSPDVVQELISAFSKLEIRRPATP